MELNEKENKAKSRSGDKQWYETAFGEDYLLRYSHRDEDEARETIKLFHQASGIEPPARILDLGCGSGRHSITLARHGYDIVGFDLSAAQLTRGRHRLSPHSHVHFVRGQMRYLPFAQNAFHAVVNLFTTFGYYETDEQNAGVVAEVQRVLKPRGYFFFDFLNKPYVEANLEARSERQLDDGLTFVECRNIVEATQRVEKTSILIHPDGRREERFESVRLFSREELEAIFDTHGLAIRWEYGDYDGKNWTMQSPRLILLAQKSS